MLIRTTESFREAIRATRRAGIPLLVIRTSDPASAISHVVAALNGKRDATPLLSYDLINGLQGRNELGVEASLEILGEASPKMGPVAFLSTLQKMNDGTELRPILPDRSIVFFFNPQRMWDEPEILQGIWNLRDIFKENTQTLIMLTTAAAILPAEIRNDVVVLDEPLPSTSDLEKLIDNTFQFAGAPEPDEQTRTRATDSLIGIPYFPAEQALSMSMSPKGCDLLNIWEQKCQTIEQTRGLSVHRGNETFDQVRGCDALAEYLTALMLGEEAPRVVVFIDEINDAFAGSGTDSSGVKGDMQGTLLTHMQNANADGVLLIGPPGTGKTLIGKATASIANRIMINFDFAGMQSGVVGSSGENLRAGLAIVDATSQGRSLWIATCNAMTNLPPQLRRRFRDGTFFVDLPDEAGRRSLWELYEKRYNVSGDRPQDDGWTGAEIENCCRKAWRLKMSLQDAARYIVPVCTSSPEQIEALRQQANNRFLSASKPGMYTYQKGVQRRIEPSKRKFVEQH